MNILDTINYTTTMTKADAEKLISKLMAERLPNEIEQSLEYRLKEVNKERNYYNVEVWDEGRYEITL